MDRKERFEEEGRVQRGDEQVGIYHSSESRKMSENHFVSTTGTSNLFECLEYMSCVNSSNIGTNETFIIIREEVYREEKGYKIFAFGLQMALTPSYFSDIHLFNTFRTVRCILLRFYI